MLTYDRRCGLFFSQVSLIVTTSNGYSFMVTRSSSNVDTMLWVLIWRTLSWFDLSWSAERCSFANWRESMASVPGRPLSGIAESEKSAWRKGRAVNAQQGQVHVVGIELEKNVRSMLLFEQRAWVSSRQTSQARSFWFFATGLSHTMHGGAFGLVDPVFVFDFGPGFCSIPAITKSSRFVAVELL